MTASEIPGPSSTCACADGDEVLAAGEVRGTCEVGAAPSVLTTRYSGAKHLGGWYAGDLAAVQAAVAQKAHKAAACKPGESGADLGRRLSSLYSGDLACVLQNTL